MTTPGDDILAVLKSFVDVVPDEDKELLRSAIDAMSRPRAVTGGVVYAGGQRPGRLAADLRTPEGIVRLRDAVEVTPIFPVGEAEFESADLDEEEFSSRTLSLVKDEAAPFEQRSEALAELLIRNDRNVSVVILQALEDPDTDIEWLGVITAAAERATFAEGDQRHRLKIAIAKATRRFQTAPGFRAELAWAGIRLYGSLIEREEVDSLVEFLAPSIGPDTRQVTLQAVQRVFENAPPEQTIPVQRLCDRICEIARLYSHPDVLTFGDNAAIALNAIQALAALDDPRAIECVRQVTAAGHGWFIDRLSDLLTRLRESWSDNKVDSQSLEHIDLTLSACSM